MRSARTVNVLGLALAALLASAIGLNAQTPPAPSSLIVATRIVPPFVMKEGDELQGFSIDLWKALAREMGVESRYVVKETLPDLFAEVRDGSAALAISAISITAEREKLFDFSQPMFDAGLQIMVSADRGNQGSGFASLLSLFSSKALRELLLVLVVLILLPAPLIWLVERRHPTSFVPSSSKPSEAAKSLWWTSSTLAGQATDMPSSFLGRVIAVIWMFVGVVFVSYFTATVTAQLTVKQLAGEIAGPRDLAGKRVATVAGSTGFLYLKQLGLEPRGFNHIADAIAALTNGAADAVVYDAPVLQYHASHDGKGKVQVSGPVFHAEAYGILFRPNEPLRKAVNGALLHLRETGEYEALRQHWFGTNGEAN